MRENITTIAQSVSAMRFESLRLQSMRNIISRILNPKPYTVNQLALPSCTHMWTLFAKNYAPPRKDVPQGLGDELFQKALLGVTTYLWECKVCSEIRKEETLGSDENQLSEILEKADTFGMQYVKEGERVFAIARVPAEDTGKLSVR